MLSVILETLESNDAELDVASHQVTPQVKRLLNVLEERGGQMTRDELQRILELKDRTSFRERYLKPALQSADKKIFKRINSLIKEIQRAPFEGTGKPETLKHGLEGYWSRRINDEHRLVYKVEGDTLLVAQLRYHY